MTYKTCAGGCGKPRKEGSPYTVCEDEACFDNYCLSWYEKRLGTKILQKEDHLLWSVPCTKRPTVAARTAAGKFKSVRVIDVIRMRNGEKIVKGDIVSSPTCGEEWCINPEHHEILWHNIVNEKPDIMPLDRIRLPFAPIHEAVTKLRSRNASNDITDDPGWRIPAKYQSIYDSAMERKTISLLRADAFCCDVLEVHPIAIFGEELYFQGLEEDAA